MCTDVKVFEFDELLCIPGCQLGKHSNEPPAIEVQRKKELAAANAAALERFDQQASYCRHATIVAHARTRGAAAAARCLSERAARCRMA